MVNSKKGNNMHTATAQACPNIAFAKQSHGNTYLVSARLVLPKYGRHILVTAQ